MHTQNFFTPLHLDASALALGLGFKAGDDAITSVGSDESQFVFAGGESGALYRAKIADNH